jgi:hypothetical protein
LERAGPPIRAVETSPAAEGLLRFGFVDGEGAPDVWLPRREVLLDWLNAFLAHAAAPHGEISEGEAADLDALRHFLRRKKVPVAV